MDIDQVAKDIVKAIVADFTDRRGLRQEWDQIDRDIRKEIISTWEKLAVKQLKKSAP